MNDKSTSESPESGKTPGYAPGLSAKLLLLTILFVMLAEVLVFAPSVSNFRRQWLMERLGTAQIASLAAEAAPGGQLPAMLRDELLKNAMVKAISVKRADARVLVIEMDMPDEVDATYDLRNASWLTLIADALMVYVNPNDRVIRVIGEPGFNKDEFIDVVMGEERLKAAMIRYGLDILGVSIIISVITAALLYLSLDWLLVKPMTGLTRNIVRFRERPEDPTRIISPSGRHDEIGTAERELSAMQRGAFRDAHPEEQACRARARGPQDQPRSRDIAVERATPLRSLADGERPDGAAPGAEADRRRSTPPSGFAPARSISDRRRRRRRGASASLWPHS